jgi:hypothetical protein
MTSLLFEFQIIYPVGKIRVVAAAAAIVSKARGFLWPAVFMYQPHLEQVIADICIKMTLLFLFLFLQCKNIAVTLKIILLLFWLAGAVRY